MPNVVFIYRIQNIDITYYGKYISDYFSDDVDLVEEEIFPFLLQHINEYRNKNNLESIKKEQLKIGIITLNINNVFWYSYKKDKDFFDFYYNNQENKNEVYICGETIDVKHNYYLSDDDTISDDNTSDN